MDPNTSLNVPNLSFYTSDTGKERTPSFLLMFSDPLQRKCDDFCSRAGVTNAAVI